MTPCFFTFAAVESWKFGKKSAEISMDNLLAKAGWQRLFCLVFGRAPNPVIVLKSIRYDMLGDHQKEDLFPWQSCIHAVCSHQPETPVPSSSVAPLSDFNSSERSAVIFKKCRDSPLSCRHFAIAEIFSKHRHFSKQNKKKKQNKNLVVGSLSGVAAWLRDTQQEREPHVPVWKVISCIILSIKMCLDGCICAHGDTHTARVC